jgi:adenylate kinase family enzyme
MRYVVVGTSGSGKTTFARELARAMSVPHIELDELHWAPKWTPRPTGEFLQSVQMATTGAGWVVDGNYSVVRGALWPRATHIVWLNFGRSVVFPRIILRTFKRSLLRQRLWAGNRETIRQAFFSHDSILLWSFSTFGKNQRKYAALREAPEYGHLSWTELRTPSKAREFIASSAYSDT